MSTPASSNKPAAQNRWATGLVLFAVAMLLIVGAIQFYEGLVAVFNDNFYVVANSYTFDIDTTAYGWTHMLIGAIFIGTGIGLSERHSWARITGIVIAALSMIANFAFIPYYPWWSLTIIALNIAVIWALSTLSFSD